VRPDKEEGRKNPPDLEPEQTPFERFVDFTRRIIAVPHSEIAVEERKYQRARLRKRQNKSRSP